ncbi:HD domain-containing phosphohydrolase [Capillimicrobium parvum]|uniref:Cyclic di-GMP phosphodiesterase response regulator RpfG n=1 Tax=Capillimicrobium parvum TaxID=2884022 RepID=A0A9E6XWV0_9ACTN|nr:HD domain-containing phosphohydrolase [Capillimicrobium parvum]UGS35272.1 Cyclic di-GMP phosphodiesterase response regulator RpfG [Capillimicrobium parvum]
MRGRDRWIEGLQILVVDDEPANVLALRALLESWHFQRVETTTDPHDALARCRTREPDLLMLDLHMPGLDGFGVMRQLRIGSRRSLSLPVLVLTADITPDVRRRALDAGARDFLTKPFDAEEVRLRVRNLLEMRELQLQHAAVEASLEARVRQRTVELESARMEMLQRLALAAEFRDDRTGEHTQRVGRTARELAFLMGLSDADGEQVGLAAPLHDVGKIAISDSILLKPGPLTPRERDVMQRHTLAGAQILRGSGSELLRTAEQIALTHHERWDGAGYPHGLCGEKIPLAGRVVAVADVFDALTHVRPYKHAWSVDRAVTTIVGDRACRFDPQVVDAFTTLEHPVLL